MGVLKIGAYALAQILKKIYTKELCKNKLRELRAHKHMRQVLCRTVFRVSCFCTVPNSGPGMQAGRNGLFP